MQAVQPIPESSDEPKFNETLVSKVAKSKNPVRYAA